MHLSIYLSQLPLVPMVGLLWRIIERRKKANYLQNWRSIQEKALFALVATALERANYKLVLTKIPPVSEIKEFYIDPNDYPSIYNTAEGVLRSLRTVLKEKEGEPKDLERLIRKQVLFSINTLIISKLGVSKTLAPDELPRNIRYAREQIVRAQELSFDGVVDQLEPILDRYT